MNDKTIVELYWRRSGDAIAETSRKYGGYCYAIAYNLLSSARDAEECVNDTYLNAWNAMPTHWPEQLSAFLGKLTRNLSFNRYKYNRAEKRGGGEFTLVLDELADCVSGKDNVEQEIDRRELTEAVNAFVAGLPERKRKIFVRRYWYADPVSEIAGVYGMGSGNVSKTLERMRKQLRNYLTERGFEL